MNNTTDKICSKCGAHLVRRENVMTTSEPALYIYDCPNCGGVEYDIHMYPCGDDACNLVHSETVDYKKLYEEALERARNELKQDLHESGIGAIKRIFPELRESEDEDKNERIRKAIIELVKEVGRDDTGISENVKSMIAYLEKQKDSIPYAKYVEDIAAIHAEARTKYHAGWNDGYEAKQKALKCDAREFTIYHPLKNGKGEYECIPYSFYGSLTSFSEDKDLIDFLRTCFYTEEECNEWIEQQKEQKPELVQHPPITYTYPSDASRDEQLKMALLALLNSDLIKVAGNKFTKQDFIDWVERQKEQKPAEWSKNDTAFLNEITDFFENKTVKLQHDLDTYAHWLKSLPERFVLQPKQWWSEEDEKQIRQIERIIESTGCSKQLQEKIHNFLISLKNRGNFLKSNTNSPCWKPSEEQMKALSDTLEFMPDTFKSKCTLVTLQADLKKLMED